jgi:hypothetical protein
MSACTRTLKILHPNASKAWMRKKRRDWIRPITFTALEEGRRTIIYGLASVIDLFHRRCPGNHFAHSSVWFSMVNLLSAFVISPDIDENGKEIPIKTEFTPGAIRYIDIDEFFTRGMDLLTFLLVRRHTQPFRVRFTPRHDKVSDLLSVT